jgi:hypothetical protein
MPDNTCCDRMTHRIVVYRNGEAKAVTTIDGYDAEPASLRQVREALGRFWQMAAGT